MSSVTPDRAGSSQRRQLASEVKRALRDLRTQLSLLNQQVSAQVELRSVDLDCLDLIIRQGPLSPSTLARHAGLHPATLTGILDRLERGGWITRERDAADRRAVLVRAQRDRNRELFQLYSGMNAAMDEICAGYDHDQLALLADFLHRTTDAGRHATDDLTDR